MDKGSIAGAIVMALCCFGCALTFSGIGFWANQSKKPINFWSGTSVPPEKVKDIPAYNRANSIMWNVYSVPYWLAGLIGCFGFMGDTFMIISAVLLSLACFPGVFLLVWRYRKIERQYIMK